MTIGNNIPFLGWGSAIGIAKETTFGTFVTSTCFLEFNTESLKYAMEEIKIESINSTRDYTKRLLGKGTADGSLEMNLDIASDACMLLMKDAFGGPVTTAAGSTGSYIHTFLVGDMINNMATTGGANQAGLSIAVRMGGSNAVYNGQTKNFTGMRVNSFTLKAEVGQPVMMTCEMLGRLMSISATIPTVVYSDVVPVNFVGVTFKTGDSITNVSAEYIKSFEIALANNLDAEQRVLGDRHVVTLPAGKRDLTVKVTQAFDTTTAYNRFISATMTAIEFTLDSLVTISATVSTTYSMKLKIPRCYLNSFTPAVSGNTPMTQELEYRAFYDTSATYVLQGIVVNATANYA